MNGLQFVVLALAVYRVTRLIVTDTILDKPREALLTRYPASDTVFAEWADGLVWSETVEGWIALEPSWLGDLVSCVWCAGFWISVVAVLLWWLAPGLVWWLALPFAFSAVVGIIESRLLG